MKPTLFVILPFALMLLSSNCRKKHDVDCGGQILLSGQFYIKEIIGDTAFVADTAFRNNYIQFQAKDKYESVEWKLGTDPRSWADSSFSLSFITALGQIPITFTGHQTPNTA